MSETAQLVQNVRQSLTGSYDVLGHIGGDGRRAQLLLGRDLVTDELVGISVTVDPADSAQFSLDILHTLPKTTSVAGSMCPECRTPLPELDAFCFHCGADLSGSSAARATPESAVVLQAITDATEGRYEILGRLDREGNTAAVYFARDLEHDFVVALRLRRVDVVEAARPEFVQKLVRIFDTGALQAKIAQRNAQQSEIERVAAERAAAERVAAERVAAERVAAERVAAERVATDRAAAERVATDRAAAERVAAERVAAERVAAERAAAERAAAERAAAERAAAERVAAERVAAERAAAERAAVERAAAERAAAERVAAERAAADRVAAARAAAGRAATELAAATKSAAEERTAAVIAAAERAAVERAAAERATDESVAAAAAAAAAATAAYAPLSIAKPAAQEDPEFPSTAAQPVAQSDASSTATPEITPQNKARSMRAPLIGVGTIALLSVLGYFAFSGGGDKTSPVATNAATSDTIKQAAATPRPADSAQPPADSVQPPVPTSTPAAGAAIAPTPGAATDSGTIRIMQVPADARVTVDGRLMRARTLRVTARAHQLAVTAKGFEPYTEKLTVASGATVRWTPKLVAIVAANTAPTNNSAPTPTNTTPTVAKKTCRELARVEDWSSALDACTAEANAGNGFAATTLGRMYAKGNGTTRDAAASTNWYRKGAAGGDHDAQTFMGFALRDGNGVKRDEKASTDMFRLAADGGDKAAQLEYAVALEKGDGVAKNQTSAREWYKKAADQGLYMAARRLARMFEKGDGGPKSEPEALAAYEKAATLGDAESAMTAGKWYRDGHGVAQSPAQALTWFKKALELGNKDAQNEIKKLQK